MLIALFKSYITNIDLIQCFIDLFNFMLFQEFHLSQTYHEGLVKLQAKEYEKARELLESVLKDPLIANAQVDRGAGDSHLLQLRFQSVLYIKLLDRRVVYHVNLLFIERSNGWHKSIVTVSCNLSFRKLLIPIIMF
jgi:hypothetical protein